MQGALAQPQVRRADRRQLLAAAGLGLLAAALVAVYLSQAAGKTESFEALSTVVVAAQPIEAGTKITEAMLATRDLPSQAIAEGVFRERTEVIGRTARYPVAKGEQVTTARLVEPPKVQALSFQIPPGMRGMTIPVSVSNTPAALIAPGDFVDVIVSIDAVSLTGRAVASIAGAAPKEFKGAATLAQNVQVLSVDRAYVNDGVVYEPSSRGQPPAAKDRVEFVTLAVTPDQAQLLWLAQTEGKLTLVLRPFGDDKIVPLTPKLEPLGQN